MAAADSLHSEQTLMFTDLVGYSRLMGRNEVMAIELLGEYRRIVLSEIGAQGGHWVECIGDGIFARFDSAVSATAAAIAIQQHLQAFNQVRDKKLPRLQTRIGLHKGEVTLRDNAVFGDTVNIAARLEPLAIADGICISQTVYDEVRFGLSAPAKRLGLQNLKNIEQKIRVYLIKPAGINWRDHLHYLVRSLNKKISAYRYPLVACLVALFAAAFYLVPRWLVPGYAANYVEIADFKNLMNEKGDADYFSAGITEAVRAQLADMRDVYIVDVHEGIHAPIKLEGSVQKLGDNLRIAYRLFRRKDNVQIAGGKLDGTYQDIFILQDRLVGEIARYLADEFDLQNFRPAPLRLTNDITAYDYYLHGLEYLEKPSTHGNSDEAIKHFSTALVHDNQFALANAGLCEAYWRKYEISNAAHWLNRAEEHCLLALSQDENSSKTYTAIGAIYRDTGRYEKAIQYLEMGLNADKRNVSLSVTIASVYFLSGDVGRAEEVYRSTISLFPKDWRGYFGYGNFLMRNGRHVDAMNCYIKVVELTPDNVFALNNIASIHLFTGDFNKAAEVLLSASDIDPSSYVFSNIGSMYYFSHNYNKSLESFEVALRLDPNSYQIMVAIADAYKYIAGREKVAAEYFKRAVAAAEAEIAINPLVAKPYYYLAISLALLDDMTRAKATLIIANRLDGIGVDALYANLRVAVIEQDDKKIRRYAKSLLDGEYSAKLLLADPDFVLLNEGRFSDLFKTKRDF